MPSHRLCVFGCVTTGVTIHTFPNPEIYPERFRKWVELAGDTLKDISDEQIFKSKKVCDKHFLKNHKNRNNRLSALASPVKHISGPLTVTALKETESNMNPQPKPCTSQQLIAQIKASAAQTNLLCNFFEENPEILRGYKKSAKSMHDVQEKWKKITPQLNAVGPARDHKSWAKYLCDMKAKFKRTRIKWRQSSDGKGPIMCNAGDFTEIRLRMLQVLRKDASNLRESQDSHTSDLETEDDNNDDDPIEDDNDEMVILPEEIPNVKPQLESPEYIKLVTNDTPPPELQPPQIIIDDEFDYFGKNVAQQLRSLPLFVALETQEMLLSVLKKQRLKVLNETSSSSDPLSK